VRPKAEASGSLAIYSGPTFSPLQVPSLEAFGKNLDGGWRKKSTRPANPDSFDLFDINGLRIAKVWLPNILQIFIWTPQLRSTGCTEKIWKSRF
jgi:hypothetical protein